MNNYEPFDLLKELRENANLTSSIYLSDITGVKHKNIIELIERHKSHLFHLGYENYKKPLKGEILDDFLKKIIKYEIKTNNYGNSKSYLLTINQVKNLLVLMGNSNEIIINYKHDIACNKFDENVLKLKNRGYVYLISDMKELYKIGRTINPIKRIRAIETQKGEKVKLIQLSDYIFEYEELERELHQLYIHKLKLGEWFKLNEDDVINISCHIEHNGLTITEFNKIKLNYYIDYNLSKNILKEN